MSNLNVNIKPSIHFCETGELEENEIYNPEIHVYNENARRRICKKAYPNLYVPLQKVKKYHPYMTFSKTNKKARGSKKKQKSKKAKKQKSKKAKNN